MNQEKISYQFDLVDIIAVLIKRKWIILGAIIITAIIGYVVAGFLPKKYKTSLVMYATASSSISNTLLNNQNNYGKGILDFGDKEQTEQLLQILSSDALVYRAAERFDLYSHYNLGPKNTNRAGLVGVFGKNVTVERTDYMAVQITVKDESQQIAKDLCNYLAFEANNYKNYIQKERAGEAFKVVETAYIQKKSEIDSLNREFEKLRRIGIYDYYLQVDGLSDAILKNNLAEVNERAKLQVYNKNKGSIPDSTIARTEAKIKGAEASLSYLAPKIEQFKKFGGDYINMIDNLKTANQDLSNLSEQYTKAKLEFEKNLSQAYIIDPAEFPEIPTEPRKKLVALASGVFAGILAIIFIVFFELLYAPLRKDVLGRII